MKLIFAALTAAMLAGPAHAQPLPDPWQALKAIAYTLAGKDYHGSVIRDGENRNAPQVDPRNHRYGQAGKGFFQSMDREVMRIAISDPRSSQVAKGGTGGVQIVLQDAADQGRDSPVTVTLRRADGSVLDSFTIAGRRTKVANGNVVRAEYTGFIPGGSRVEVTSGPGKMNRPSKDRGDPGQGDGFIVKARAIPDCPDDETNKFTVKRTFRTVESGPVRHPQMVPSANKKSDKGGKGGGKSGKSRR